ncbi:uncharacterized protein TNCV_4258091 [Trichonephila clavipes]|nr:uncharacterized protein TNCV_4258091 [Trichonephila clavipes]
MSNVGNNRGNWRNSEVVHRPNSGRNDYRGNYQNSRQGNQWFESRNRFQNDDRKFNDRGYQFKNRGQNDDFNRGDQRNRGSSENFSRGSRKQMGRLNVLKVTDIKGGSKIILDFDRRSLAIQDSKVEDIKVDKGNLRVDLSETKLNVVANVLDNNTVEGPYKVLDVKNNNVVIWKAGKRLTINVDQVRIYRHRKWDETEIGTGSSDNGSLRDESRGFDTVQRRSIESRVGKKKGSECVAKIKKKKNRREETVTPTTSGYNLRPRKGKREESRLTIERKTQQGGPVRSRKGRERNDSPYIEERRSSNKNARRGGDQQRQDQESRGTCTKKALSLEVLVGNANYKSKEPGRIVSFYILSNK